MLADKSRKGNKTINLAIEFNSHAACAHVAKHNGWFEEYGLQINTYDSYMTGMALASALARGSIDAAYICLIPAINAYANAGIPIKVVAGTHKYGYGLAVNPDKIRTVKDLENPKIRIGCTREGSPTDALLHKMIEKYNLDPTTVLTNVRRMNSTEQLLALKIGQLDAGIMGEQYPTLAEELGFTLLLTAQDLWPDMQGSVLIVTDDLLKNHGDIVESLVRITRLSTDWIADHPDEAAAIVASELTNIGERIFPTSVAKLSTELEISPSAVLKSLTMRMICTTDIDSNEVQNTIDYAASIGNIKQRVDAVEILDLRWLAHDQ
ncbi:MAG: ABC transporter substrate-binding protein [Deltaproteobacteria bacterium]|nr:ABC transporter substrate-binding protein [Deltaproteobacteria bacterium]